MRTPAGRPAGAPRPLPIRPGGLADLERCREIERAAGVCFRALDMAAVADDEPLPVGELAGYARAGGLWVAYEAGGAVYGYLLAEPVDGCTHVEQVSVHPDRARRGVGAALLDHAAAVGARPLTLTTFAEVPWNAPYYARLGFRVLPAGELTPGLRRIRAHEEQAGLDRWPRVCMRRDG